MEGKRTSYKKCCICHRKRIPGTNIFLGALPLNPVRCRLWVKAIGNEDLVHVPIEKLHELKYVCDLHFTTNDFNKSCTRLLVHAVPTQKLTAEMLPDEIFRDFPLHIGQHPNPINTDTVESTMDPKNEAASLAAKQGDTVSTGETRSLPTSQSTQCKAPNVDAVPGPSSENIVNVQSDKIMRKCAESKGHQDIILEATKTTTQPSKDESVSQTLLQEADDAETIGDDDTAVAVDDYDELFDDEVPHLKTGDPVKLESSKDVPEAERIVHSGFKCNSCLGEIVGFRYRCVQCADYDLCPRCESSAAHAAHYVLRVPRPAPPAEVRGVLAAVRLALRLPPAADLGPEVKEEPDCVDLAEEVHEAPETAACRVDPLELDAVNQNELEFPSDTEPEFPSDAGPESAHRPQATVESNNNGPHATEPPAKKLKRIILKRVSKPLELNPIALRDHIKQHKPAARKLIDLSRITFRVLQTDPLKLDITRPVTNTPKPVAVQPEARRPILVSPRGSTAAAASGGAGGLPIVRLSRLPDRLTRAHLGR